RVSCVGVGSCEVKVGDISVGANVAGASATCVFVAGGSVAVTTMTAGCVGTARVGRMLGSTPITATTIAPIAAIAAVIIGVRFFDSGFGGGLLIQPLRLPVFERSFDLLCGGQGGNDA